MVVWWYLYVCWESWGVEREEMGASFTGLPPPSPPAHRAGIFSLPSHRAGILLVPPKSRR